MDNSGESALNEPRVSNQFKQFIVKITNMRTRDGVTSFKVKWGPGGHEVREPAAVVIRERVGLKNWLEELMVERPRKYSYIMLHHPEFAQVLEHEE